MANFHGQTRLLRRHLRAKLYNIGWYSQTQQVDKDVSFHLRSSLLILKNEYKRRQSAPGPKISVNAFGRERRYPMTSKFQP